MGATGWWLFAAALLVAFIAGTLWSRWKQKRRRTPDETAERVEIRALWHLAKQVPTRELLRDPETGRYIGVDRHHSMLEVLVSDLDFTDPRTDDVTDAVVTAYHLGSVWRPMPPPVMRMHTPLNDTGTSRTWREAGDLLDFNDHTGAMNTSATELADLHAQLNRALHA